MLCRLKCGAFTGMVGEKSCDLDRTNEFLHITHDTTAPQITFRPDRQSVRPLTVSSCTHPQGFSEVFSGYQQRRVGCLYKTDVSRTISVSINRDLICQRSPCCLVYTPPQATCCRTGRPMEGDGGQKVAWGGIRECIQKLPD
jgi:hypothetical protein